MSEGAAQSQHHEELAEFASLERSATAESEQALAGRVAELEAQLAERVSAQDSTEAQLRAAHAALAQAEDKVFPRLRQRLMRRVWSECSGLPHMNSVLSRPMRCP